MIVLVMKTKVHSFMALLIAAMITGIIGGMPISDITLADGTTQTGLITAIQEGFGSTLKSTGIIWRNPELPKKWHTALSN